MGAEAGRNPLPCRPGQRGRHRHQPSGPGNPAAGKPSPWENRPQRYRRQRFSQAQAGVPDHRLPRAHPPAARVLGHRLPARRRARTRPCPLLESARRYPGSGRTAAFRNRNLQLRPGSARRHHAGIQRPGARITPGVQKTKAAAHYARQLRRCYPGNSHYRAQRAIAGFCGGQPRKRPNRSNLRRSPTTTTRASSPSISGKTRSRRFCMLRSTGAPCSMAN